MNRTETPAQRSAIAKLIETEGHPYWPSLGVRANGVMDVTFRSGSGFVITPGGEVRPA